MTVIAVQDWAPDAASLGNPGALKAENVLPGPTGYKPFPSWVAQTGALDDRPRGAISARDDALVTYLYAGDAAKLYSLSGSSWSDASRGGGYTTASDERWEFARFKDRVLATNFTDSPQVIDLGSSAFSDLTTAFRARHMAVVREFVVMGNTHDSAAGNQVDRVRWSAFNDETSWAPNSQTGADVRNLNVGGPIQRIFGGEYGVILSDRSTWRMTWQGAPSWFAIEEVLPGVGAIAPGAAAQFGDSVFFLSDSGFVRILNGREAAFIGTGRVDRFVLDDLDTANLHRISAVVDPNSTRVVWAYPGAGATAGRPNKLVIYDWSLNKWSYACVDVELLWAATGGSTTLEQLDSVSASIDDLSPSLDSPVWVGDSIAIAAFGSQYRSGFFSGPAMTGLVETKEIEPNPGHRTTLLAFRALADSASVSARVGTRSSMGSAVTWASAQAPRPGGRIPVRATGRFHRFEVSLSGDWSDVVGVEVDAADARRSGRRG